MPATGNLTGFPRWVGAQVQFDAPGIYATTATRARDGSLSVHLKVHVPRVRGALYGAWLRLRHALKGY
ncbi:hypothetical protein ABZW38_02875 [Streptomyces bacillaris]|uniref:hypothetical protein n=1 Tax=Streptomyces bacillaris TaxID=68179 RepID=UPI00345F7660